MKKKLKDIMVMIPGKMKKHKKLTAVLLALFVAVGVFSGRLVLTKKAKGEEQIQTQKAAKGTIKKTVEGSGSVASAATQTVSFSSDVTVQSIKKKDGASVKKGDTIAVLNSSSLEDSISSLESQISSLESTLSQGTESASSTISSKVSGRVKRIYAKEGAAVSKTMDSKGALMEISADGKLKVEFKPSKTVKTGDSVTVKFGSYSVSGKVSSVSSGKAAVTISDSYYYDVDTKASVYNSSSQKLGSGKLKSNSPITVTGDQGTVSSIDVSKNQKVYSGTTLITLSGAGYSKTYKSNLAKHEALVGQLEELKKEKQNLTVTAKYNGVVDELSASTGSTVSKGKTFCKVVSTSSYKVNIDVDELDIKAIKTGQSVSVTADAVEDKTFKGTVTKVSKIGTNTDGVATYPVTIELSDAEDLYPAMSATATITTQEASNAVLVPVSAIQSKDGKSYVTVISDGSQEGISKEVEVGIINDSYAQIISGVSEGDQVQVITRSSSNKSSDDNKMGPGGQSGENGKDGGSGAPGSPDGGSGMPGGAR